MKRSRGFKVGKRFFRFCRRVFRKTRMRPHSSLRSRKLGLKSGLNAFTKLLNFSRRLSNGAKLLCSNRLGSGYIPVGHEPVCEKPRQVPRGHLAVYVGGKDGDCHRVFVPVIYFNHPLFGELLREAENEYGFCQPGGINIPCPYSDFERVQTRIESRSGSRKAISWSRHH